MTFVAFHSTNIAMKQAMPKAKMRAMEKVGCLESLTIFTMVETTPAKLRKPVPISPAYKFDMVVVFDPRHDVV